MPELEERIAVRFIPACAGNRSLISYDVMARPVHPRMCGEQEALLAGRGLCLGSSPHVRGTGGAARRGGHIDRFIPACAGNRPISTALRRM